MYNSTVNFGSPTPTPQTAGVFNDTLARAQAASDMRFNLKQYDRPGLSRGRGQQGMAGIQASQNLADGVADAYQVPMQDAAGDAQNALQYQRGLENFGVTAAGLAAQNDYAAALAGLQRQQQMMNFQGNALGGLLGALGGASSGKSNWLDNFLGY